MIGPLSLAPSSDMTLLVLLAVLVCVWARDAMYALILPTFLVCEICSPASKSWIKKIHTEYVIYPAIIKFNFKDLPCTLLADQVFELVSLSSCYVNYMLQDSNCMTICTTFCLVQLIDNLEFAVVLMKHQATCLLFSSVLNVLYQKCYK